MSPRKRSEVGMIIKHETRLDTNPSLPESTQLTTLVTGVVETRGFGVLGSFFPVSAAVTASAF